MGSLFSKQPPPPNSYLQTRRYQAAVIGLEGAGKTNILHRLCPRKDSPSPFLLESVPTVGIDIYILPHEVLSPLKHHHHYIPPPPLSPLPKTTSHRLSSPNADKNKNKDKDQNSSNNVASPSLSFDNATTNTPKEQQVEHLKEQEHPPSDTKNIKLLFYDFSGSQRYRYSIQPLVKETQALIYVLDATAPLARFQESRRLLREILEEWMDDSFKIPLLVFANKMEFPEAWTVEEVRDWLALGQWAELGWGARAAAVASAAGGGGGGSIEDERREEKRRKDEEKRVWRLQGASAATGEGLMEGIDWLVVQLEVQRCEENREEDARQRG